MPKSLQKTSKRVEEAQYINRCLSLARQGLGSTYPNPMVGAVVVYDHKIIGEGWHQRCGGPHAEVCAIESVQDKSILKKSTLYVNLEPCCHYGKTPPCTTLIIQNNIPKVIIGCADPNPLVSGQGIQVLKSKGIEVLSPLLEKNCQQLNKRFFTYQKQKRPYIILKWAETNDGFMDIYRQNNIQKNQYWISHPNTKTLVHRWRSEESAVLVGTQTAINDNPRLTARDWYADRQPLRIALDSTGRIPKSHALYDNTSPTLIYSEKLKPQKLKTTEIAPLNFENKTLQNLLKDLHKREIQSVLVEGGATLLNSFLQQNLWDEARIIKSPQTLIDGLKAPVLKSKIVETFSLGKDRIETHINQKR